MAPFVKFLDSARRLIPMGMTRQQIFNFAKQEFGEVNQLMKKQIDNLFKPKKPVGKKDPDFDNTVEKMQFDDEGVPFNPRNPLKKAEGGRAGFGGGGTMGASDKGYQGGGRDKKGNVSGTAPGAAPGPGGNNNNDGPSGPPSIINPPPKDNKPPIITTSDDSVNRGFLSDVRKKNQKKYLGILNKYKPDDFDALYNLDPTAITEEDSKFLKSYGIGTVYKDLSKTNIENFFDIFPKGVPPKKDPTSYSGDYKYNFAELSQPQLDSIGVPKMTAADGGRAGFKDGEGIMQMASAPEPMDERNELSLQIFGKPIKLLTPEEMDMLNDEAERLMQKFSSAPDPMDERNMVMENIAIKEFGKPLKDLNEEEIIEIEIMIDEMTEKPNRGAQSIKLADGGITRVGLKDGVLKRGLKAITDTDTYKTFEDRGFNTAVLMSEGFDQIYNLLSGVPFAEGGRAAFKDGPPDPTKRKFMKAAVGIASMIPGIGMLGKGAKVAAPVVAKAAEITGPALSKIVETVMSLGKTISQSGRRLKELTTKKKHKGIEVEEDNLDGSYIIKKGDKEIYYKPGRMDETGGIEDDIIEVIDKTVKKAGGGIARMLGE